MFKLMGKKIITILHLDFLIWIYGYITIHHNKIWPLCIPKHFAPTVAMLSVIRLAANLAHSDLQIDSGTFFTLIIASLKTNRPNMQIIGREKFHCALISQPHGNYLL